MTGTFVLILALYTGVGTAPGVVAHEFATKEACTDAGKAMVKAFGGGFASGVFVCVPSGGAK